MIQLIVEVDGRRLGPVELDPKPEKKSGDEEATESAEFKVARLGSGASDDFCVLDPSLSDSALELWNEKGALHIRASSQETTVAVGGSALASSSKKLAVGAKLRVGRLLLRLRAPEKPSDPWLLEGSAQRVFYSVKANKRAGHDNVEGTRPATAKELELWLGRGPRCELRWRDPLLHTEQARISYSKGEFWIAACTSATGTHLDGVRLPEHSVEQVRGAEAAFGQRLETHHSLVVAGTRLNAYVYGEGEGSWLLLNHEQAAFGFDIIPADAQAWPVGELDYGRSRWMRAANLIAGVLALLLLLAVVRSQEMEEEWLEPGPLDAHHAQLFSVDLDRLPTLTADQRAFAAMVASAQEQGCAVCHVRGERPTLERCSQCHADLMRNQHPRSAEPALGVPERDGVHAAYGGSDCMECHVGHLGSERDEAELRPPLHQTEQSCASCHEGQSEWRPEEIAGQPAPVEEPRQVYGNYDAFPHAAHVGLPDEWGGEIACSTCHVRDPEPAEASAPVAGDRGSHDFSAVSYERCLRCHDQESRPEFEPWQEVMRPGLRASLRWHGTRDESTEAAERFSDCTGCHELQDETDRTTSWPRTWDIELQAWVSEVGPWVSGELRELERPVFEDPVVHLHLRHHGAEFTQADCGTCHVDGVPRGYVPRTDYVKRRFWHALHMESLDPEDPAAARALEASCIACHGEVAAGGALSAGLARDAYRGPDLSTCLPCHSTQERGATNLIGEVVLEPVPPESVYGRPEPRVETVLDFPHGPHLGSADPLLADGCLSCHSFETVPGSERPRIERAVTTSEAAKDCRSCHVSDSDSPWPNQPHANVGGGNCFPCHERGDVSILGLSFSRLWPPLNDFDHFSPGHSVPELTCASCHAGGEPAVGDAQDVRSVPIPDESQRECRECHVGGRQRFHWR